MKRIINEKIYDTETAKKICSYNNGVFDGGFLYKTKKGNYFCTWEISRELKKMCVEEVKEYLSYSPELYIQEFGEVGEA